MVLRGGLVRVAAISAMALVANTGRAAEHTTTTTGVCTACVDGPITGCGDWDAADIACMGACSSQAQQTSCQQEGCMPGQIQYICG